MLTCKVGGPLTVTMTGVADRVDFWSGEEGPDYAYSEKDRMQEADMTTSSGCCLPAELSVHRSR